MQITYEVIAINFQRFAYYGTMTSTVTNFYKKWIKNRSMYKLEA